MCLVKLFSKLHGIDASPNYKKGGNYAYKSYCDLKYNNKVCIKQIMMSLFISHLEKDPDFPKWNTSTHHCIYRTEKCLILTIYIKYLVKQVALY